MNQTISFDITFEETDVLKGLLAEIQSKSAVLSIGDKECGRVVGSRRLTIDGEEALELSVVKT